MRDATEARERGVDSESLATASHREGPPRLGDLPQLEQARHPRGFDGCEHPPLRLALRPRPRENMHVQAQAEGGEEAYPQGGARERRALGVGEEEACERVQEDDDCGGDEDSVDGG